MPDTPENCEICRSPWAVHWCDHHGIAACNTCGAPYRLYHYEGKGSDRKRVDKPAELLVKPEWREWTRALWKEKGTNVAPGFFCFQGSSYDWSKPGDHEALEAWEKAHPDPKEFSQEKIA